MAYGQQHFLVWFFIPATPSYTSFSDFSPSVTRSFIRKKLFFENFMLWYLCCRIWNYGDYGPLGYGLSYCCSHCSVSSTFIRFHLILLWRVIQGSNPRDILFCDLRSFDMFCNMVFLKHRCEGKYPLFVSQTQISVKIKNLHRPYNFHKIPWN